MGLYLAMVLMFISLMFGDTEELFVYVLTMCLIFTLGDLVV